ncbi:MAG: host attachment protein [Rhodobacterales bacterium]|nr:host attachment protein [Rhodobacterales bacterium]
MKAADTLYCIADDHSFRILRGKRGRIVPINAAVADDFPDVSKALTDPGRNRSVGVSFTHETGKAIEIERPRLARHIVAALEAEWRQGGVGRVILAAAPKMLGELRKAMPKDLAEDITQEFDKDLSDVPDQDLAAHLER